MSERGRPRHSGPLTDGESRVVKLVAKGLTNREVGDALGITERTVKFHLNQVYSKLGLETREELIAWQRQRRFPSLLGVGWLTKAAAVAGAAGGVFIVGSIAINAGNSGDEGSGADDAEIPCQVDSVLLRPSMEIECVPDEELEAAFGAALYRPPPGAVVLEAAIVREGTETYAFRRYSYGGGELDTLQGDYQVPWGQTRDRPFVAGDSPLGNFGTVAGQDVLYLCPEYDPSQSLQLESVDSCPEDSALVLTGRNEAVLGSVAVIIFPPRVGIPSTPVPFPTPMGERVQPMVAGVPAYPRATEIDGFVLQETEYMPVLHVQVFETADFQSQVFSYLVNELELLGWRATGGGHGVSGRSATFVSPTGGLVTVSTIYVAREEDQDVQPPPGFRGKGVPFEERIDGKSRFWIMTSEEQPREYR